MGVNSQSAFGGSPKQNSVANQIYTKADLSAYIAASPDNMLGYLISRNPSAAYKFIKANYGSDFTNLLPGAEVNVPVMNSMHDFLLGKYNGSTNKVKFLTDFKNSIPAAAQLQNWTTPIN